MLNDTKELYDQKVITLTLGAQFSDLYRKREYGHTHQYINFSEYLRKNYPEHSESRIMQCLHIYSMVERCDLTIHDVVSFSDYHLEKIARYVHKKNYKEWFTWLEKNRTLPKYLFVRALARRLKERSRNHVLYQFSKDKEYRRQSLTLTSNKDYLWFSTKIKEYKQQMGLKSINAVLNQLIQEHEIGLQAYDLDTILNHLNKTYPHLLIEVSTL